MSKMRCKDCIFLNYDMLSQVQRYPNKGRDFCGQHGRARIDINGDQQNLDHRGSCGFYPKKVKKLPVQLELF